MGQHGVPMTLAEIALTLVLMIGCGMTSYWIGLKQGGAVTSVVLLTCMEEFLKNKLGKTETRSLLGHNLNRFHTWMLEELDDG